MKKYGLMLLVGSILGAGCSWADSVYSNTVGFQRTDVLEGYNMISCPFGDDGVDIQDFIKNLDDLTAGTTLATVDQLLLYNGSSYDTYGLYDDGSTVFWLTDSDLAWAGFPIPPSASSANLQKGTGCWIKLNADETIVTSGTAQSSTNVPVEVAEEFTIVSHPFSSGTPVKDIPTTGLQGGTALTSVDAILIFNGTTYDTFGLYDNSSVRIWLKDDHLAWAGFPITPTEATETVGMGGAFWLKRPGATGAPMELTFAPPADY